MSKEIDINKTIDQLVQKGVGALTEFKKLNQEEVDYIVKKATVAAIDAHGELAMHAVKETKRGVFEDKATKNMFSAENVQNYMRDLKTVGVIAEDETKGIVEIAEPVGVVCGVTPVTNPTSTTIFKSLIALKTRNPIIFAFHPSAQECSAHAAQVVLEAAVKAGAPKDVIQWVKTPSIEATNALMKHDDIATILATGGNAMVKSAYSSGKPALGVGAGNVPAFIEKSAKLERAVYDIVLSKSFDNGMICASEQAAIIEKPIYKKAIELFKEYHVYFVNDQEKKLLEEYVFGCHANDKSCSGAKLNAGVVGQSAPSIAKAAGFKVPEDTVILAAECNEVGEKEPLTREKLSPILAILNAKDAKDGIEKARQMVEFNGLGHSAAIHTTSDEIAREFADVVPAVRVINNAPSTFGGIGDVYNSIKPSMTLGCGSYGNNSVSDNVGPLNLINIKRLAKRRKNMQWFKIPNKIYFEKYSIEYLQTMKDVNRVVVVADKMMEELGYVEKVMEQLRMRHNDVRIQAFTDVEPDPDISTVERGAELMKQFKPDTIIALGGGSPMDAAKIMWLFYERPDIDFKDLYQKFIDIRKRAFKYGELGEKAKFVAIPTTSGTGSEVTPFAVISDKENDKKYPLADYALTPTIAILDPQFVEALPKTVAAHTGLDVLTHAIESYVSILANDITDGLSLHAIKLVFENLEKSVNEADEVAREKMHNASLLAGMSFANAFLGINHSLAHKMGGKFHTIHGLTNAILMPYVIRYNATKPGKLGLWPKYETFNADVRYQEIAKHIGLPAKTPQEGVESLIQAVIKLRKACNVEDSFKAIGVDETAFLAEKHNLALLAYEDQCTPVNPRLAMVDDMEQILEDAYYGREVK